MKRISILIISLLLVLTSCGAPAKAPVRIGEAPYTIVDYDGNVIDSGIFTEEIETAPENIQCQYIGIDGSVYLIKKSRKPLRQWLYETFYVYRNSTHCIVFFNTM